MLKHAESCRGGAAPSARRPGRVAAVAAVVVGAAPDRAAGTVGVTGGRRPAEPPDRATGGGVAAYGRAVAVPLRRTGSGRAVGPGPARPAEPGGHRLDRR